MKENLWQMRHGIDQYSSDKGKPPQSIHDLVKGKYLREMPIDPITEKSDWTEVKSDDTSDGQQQEPGMKDVKSASEGNDSDGKAYSDY